MCIYHLQFLLVNFTIGWIPPHKYIDSDSVTVYTRTMPEQSDHMSIEELAEQVDISVRTVRYYITEGLLPGPEGRGKGAIYGEEHLLKLRLIRLLSQKHMPLAEMYHLLNRLALTEIRSMLAEEQRARELEQESQPLPPEEYIANLLRNAQAGRQDTLPEGSHTRRRLAEAPAAPEYSSSGKSGHTFPAQTGEIWRRWELAPGIELFINADAEERHHTLIERLFKIAGIPFQRFHK
jgi:DNA-binding transcriptional MerR regulator